MGKIIGKGKSIVGIVIATIFAEHLIPDFIVDLFDNSLRDFNPNVTAFVIEYQEIWRWMILLSIFSVGLFLGNLYRTIKERRKFKESTRLHHKVVHISRDLAIKMICGSNRQISFSALTLLNDHGSDLYKIIERQIRMMEVNVRRCKIYVCLRLKIGEAYHTVLRVGQHNDSRIMNTEAIPESSNFIGDLKKTFDQNDCVMITGSEFDHWPKHKNDVYLENLSVMTGSIYSKSWDGIKIHNNDLEMVISFNANKRNIFKDYHKPLIKCCLDEISLLLACSNSVVSANSEVESS